MSGWCHTCRWAYTSHGKDILHVCKRIRCTSYVYNILHILFTIHIVFCLQCTSYFGKHMMYCHTYTNIWCTLCPVAHIHKHWRTCPFTKALLYAHCTSYVCHDCNTLQHTATHCNTLHITCVPWLMCAHLYVWHDPLINKWRVICVPCLLHVCTSTCVPWLINKWHRFTSLVGESCHTCTCLISKSRRMSCESKSVVDESFMWI